MGRWFPGLTLALALAAHTATAEQPILGPSKTPSTIARSPQAAEPPGFNPALRLSRDRLSSTNLLLPGPKRSTEEMVEDARQLLEMARAQRANQEFDQARANLVQVMNTELPEELWQTALLELALLAEDQQDLPRAQQIFAQYAARWPLDLNLPEILLRQGLLYRKMGLNGMAVNKFYSVMTAALVIQAERFDHYQRLVLQAQTEVAETFLQAGNYARARDSLVKLLKLDAPSLNRPQVQFKLVRVLSHLGNPQDLAGAARDYLERYSAEAEAPEVRYLLSSALKEQGREQESLEQVLLLLQQRPTTGLDPALLAHWQQRAGNEIANQLYRGGDYLRALEVYSALASLYEALAWRGPALYQIGLIYEKLGQPEKAGELYQQILGRDPEAQASNQTSLKTLMELARWRSQFLHWRQEAEATRRSFSEPNLNPEPAAATEPTSS